MAFDPFKGFVGGAGAGSTDPDVRRRLMLAQLLQQNDAPATTPIGVVGKTLNGALQGYLLSSASDAEAARDQGKLDTMAQALQAGQGGVKEFRNPDSPGQVLIPGQQPGMDAMVSVLMGNKDTAPLGLKQAMDSMTLKQKSKAELASDLAKKGLSIGPDGTVVPLPGYGTATAANEAPAAGARKAAELSAEAAGQPAVIRATIPAAAEKAAAIAGAETPALVSRAAQTATATAPIQTQQAINTARGVAPIHTQQAIDTAQGTQPIQVETQRQIETNNQAITQPQRDRQSEKGLREEFNALPPVKNYRETVTQYNGIVEASKHDTKASDLNIVYGLAKIFDPGSVVREGETWMVQNTASLPDWLQGNINAVNGGAKLTHETRKALLAEAAGRVKAQESVYTQLKGHYTDIANRYHVKPENVIADVATPPPPAAPIAPPARADIEAEMRRRGLLK